MSRFGRFSWGVTSLAIFALLIFGLLNAQAIADWWQLRNYSPPATIEAVARADTMTEEAKRTFFVTKPELISDADAFRKSCPTFEQTVVLGCYHSGFSSSIYIYNVQDDRLSGVVEVTAAHEMLHSAYDRLGEEEKNRINGILNSFYNNGLQDERVLETIESYKQTEPTQLINEMHSIFGTELSNLPAELESYYQRYFMNRQAVVAFADKYADEFADRQAQIKEYQARLNDLKAEIDSEEASLSRQQQQIETDRRRLESLRTSGQVEEYNSSVAGFNALVNEYNAGVAELRKDIAEFNRLVALHNELAAELSSLYKSLDTSLSPQTAR
jgi:hypothetical protein